MSTEDTGETSRDDGTGRRRALVDGDGDCTHPTAARRYLGQMGTASFYRCERCEGVVVAWPTG